MAEKVKVLTTWLSGCSGCHLAFADINEAIIDVMEYADFEHSPVLMDVKYDEIPDVNVAIVEGGIRNDENHEMAEKYLNGNYGGIVGFGIKGGLEEGKKFIESVELLSHVANIGDAKSLVIHPASTTHSNMTEEEQLEGGITPDFIRMSVGIEDAEDLKGFSSEGYWFSPQQSNDSKFVFIRA